jgi:AraC family transcriptional regulator
MEWLDRMNHAMEYIEEHIAEDIDYSKVSKYACCSAYHFQRVFSFITNISLSEYIRRRRLTIAAFELQSSDIKVIDVALKYGYESPEAFSRAFKKLHGVMPTSARDKGIMLKAYPKISFHILINGGVDMNYRIEEKEPFEMFGLSTDIRVEQPFIEIPKFWDKCNQDNSIDRLADAAGKDITGIDKNLCCHGALYNFREGVFSYMICFKTPENGMPAGYTALSVPKLTWAIFQTSESEDADDIGAQIQNIWSRIFPEWFPTSEYEHADGPEFEMFYHKQDGFSRPKYIAEVWIPIEKRQ